MQVLPPELLEYESYSYLPLIDLFPLRKLSPELYRSYLRELRIQGRDLQSWMDAISASNGELFTDLLESVRLPVSFEDMVWLLLRSPSLLAILIQSYPDGPRRFVDMVYGPSACQDGTCFSYERFVELLVEYPELLNILYDELVGVESFLADVHWAMSRLGWDIRDFYSFVENIYLDRGDLPQGWKENLLSQWYGQGGRVDIGGDPLLDSLSDLERRMLEEMLL